MMHLFQRVYQTSQCNNTFVKPGNKLQTLNVLSIQLRARAFPNHDRGNNHDFYNVLSRHHW